MKTLKLFLVFIFASAQLYSQKWVKVWGDEFNTPGLPDSTKWSYEVGKIRNNELQYYTYKRSENARVQDTTLIIELRKEPFAGASYTSASLISRYKGDWLYGKFEIKAKVPEGKGTWPALWMMPTDEEYGSWPHSGEIDIMEYVGMDASSLHFTAHYLGTNGTGHQQSTTHATTNNPFSRFITFSVIWSPDKIEWYADGVKYFTYQKTATDYRVWPFDKMFYLLLNNAYGGTWGGQQGVDDTKLPNKFEIDYVRVYQLQESAGPFTLSITPATGGAVNVSPSLSTYPDGISVTLTATPEPTYQFDKWLHVGSANPITVQVVNNTTIIPVFKKINELVKNGDFTDGLKNWSALWFNSPSTTAASASVVNGVYVVDVTKPGTENWHIVEQQSSLIIEKGTTYQVSFEAWADQSNTMEVALSKNYGDYATYYSTVKNITTTKQKFTWTVTMTNNTDANCRFGFWFGKFQGKVYIDNVSFAKAAPTGVEGLSGSDGNIRVFPNPASDMVTIEFGEFSKSPVTIKLFNAGGQLVAILWNKQTTTRGQTISFNPHDLKIEKGVYFLTISSDQKNSVKKLIVN